MLASPLDVRYNALSNQTVTPSMMGASWSCYTIGLGGPAVRAVGSWGTVTKREMGMGRKWKWDEKGLWVGGEHNS